MNVDAVLGGDLRGILGRNSNDVLHLGLDLGGAGRGQVDFVDDRQHLQPCVNGQIGVGQSLGLHPLTGVHHQHRALAGCQRPGYLVVEVHMARGVDEVQVVGFAVVGGVVQLHGGGLDGNAPLPLQIHGVQELLGPGPLVHGVALLHQPVRQGGLAVVNVGNYGKITNMGKIRHRLVPL